MLKAFHRILIASGIALGLLLVLFAGVRDVAYADPTLRVAGGIGAAAALLLGLYLRWFLRRG